MKKIIIYIKYIGQTVTIDISLKNKLISYLYFKYIIICMNTKLLKS